MLKSLKIFLIILGLGAFILPTQMLSAQTIEKCCSTTSENKDCCKKETEKPCHSDNSKENGTSSCGNECANCHTCSILLISTSVPAEFFVATAPVISYQNLVFSYTIPFFSSKIQNIWQPPKLG